jgi:carbohydrate ABC transporter substrate-binding protein, CUT1 family (TC 3.A.1.1.-)
MLGIGGNEFYQKAIVELDMDALGGSTMVKVFDQMRKLQGFTDKGYAGTRLERSNRYGHER